MNKHDPLNRKCLQNCVVNRGARVSCAHLHHDCTCPAQKEDPFGDFMKSQGINVVDVTPTQKEEWEQEYITLIGTLMELSAFSAYISSFHHAKTVEFIRSQISLAEARGREEANKCDECGGTDVVCAKGVMDSIRLARTETITAFEEWAGKYMTETTKYYGTDKHGINPDDLLSFASSLKSNAPKV